MKTPLTELREWVDTTLKLEGYEHKEIVAKISELLPKEREGIESAYEQGDWDRLRFREMGIRKFENGKDYLNHTFKN